MHYRISSSNDSNFGTSISVLLKYIVRRKEDLLLACDTDDFHHILDVFYDPVSVQFNHGRTVLKPVCWST